MNHTCEYCTSLRSPKRRMLFHLLQASPNMVSTRAARQLGTNRNTIMEWREEGAKRGCIPPRTMDGRTAGGRAGGFAKVAILNNRIRYPVYPIGTLCTDERTVRAA